MGWIAAALQVARDLVALPRPMTLDLEPLQTFDTSPRPIDQVITAMRNNDMSRVTRELALSVAAVQRGRNELCSIATLPLRLYRGLDVQPSALFRQYDPDVPNIKHMADTIEDLAFESIAWWRVTGQDFDGYPIAVKRIDPCKVKLDDPAGKDKSGRYVWIDHGNGKVAERVPATLMIRFDSPNPGILKVNARSIRRAILLDRVAEMYANNPALREYFTDNPAADVDPMEEYEIDSFLAEYGAMRQVRPYGWIPGNVQRADVSTPSPRDLTLVDLQRQVTLEIANGLGVDPEDLGVSTTSRTYFNSVDKKQDKINRTYAPFMQAITDRLSMGDVTRRGYAARFDLSDYLKASPNEQADYYLKLEAANVIDRAEVRGFLGISGAPPAEPVAPAAPALPAASSARPPLQLGDITPARQFSGAGPAFTFNTVDFADAPAAPAVDQAARTITGVAVPYNAVANKYGLKYSFKPGSLEYSSPDRMAHLKDHGTPVGFHRSITDGPAGPVVELAVLDGPPGSPAKIERDQLLYDAEHGLYSGLSIGVDFNMDPEAGDVEYDAETGVYNVIRATWRETSTTYMPAFDDARVTKVAASLTGEPMDPCQYCGHKHAASIACSTFRAQLLGQQSAATPPAPAPAAAPAGGAVDQAAANAGDSAALARLVSLMNQSNAPALFGAGPTPVNPHAPAQVTEPSPYRFDRRGNLRAGSHDFSTDLLAGFRPGGDQAARDRAQEFVGDYFDAQDKAAQEQFAITPANVTALNYPANRPDLYVDQLEYQYPLYNAVNKGTLDAVTPFVVPKFNSSSGLVADHVTGTEPTPGAFTATAQTITPSPVSGKVEVTREAVDQGGNPQMSGLIWRQMVRGWYEALEAYVQAQLVALAASVPDITITTALADSALDQGITDALVPLQYIRGGDYFDTVFTQIDLYKAMVKAKDTAGRRLYPQIGAQNAVGTTTRGYTQIDAHGKLWIPAWALAATGTVAASSWMFNREVVCLWASAPRQINLEWRVAWVDIGIWGYKAFAVTDFTQTRELIYDPV